MRRGCGCTACDIRAGKGSQKRSQRQHTAVWTMFLSVLSAEAPKAGNVPDRKDRVLLNAQRKVISSRDRRDRRGEDWQRISYGMLTASDMGESRTLETLAKRDAHLGSLMRMRYKENAATGWLRPRLHRSQSAALQGENGRYPMGDLDGQSLSSASGSLGRRSRAGTMTSESDGSPEVQQWPVAGLSKESRLGLS